MYCDDFGVSSVPENAKDWRGVERGTSNPGERTCIRVELVGRVYGEVSFPPICFNGLVRT